MTRDDVIGTLDDVIGTLKDHADALRARGVVRLALIGSVARGDASEGSDVDVLVDMDRNRELTLIEHSGLRLFLCDILERDTDVLMRDALAPSLLKRIQRDEVPVF